MGPNAPKRGPSSSGRQRGACTLQVEPQGGHRRLADGHEARLSALSLDAQLLAVVVDVYSLQRQELGRAQAAPVGELEHRPVAYLERVASGDRVEQRCRLARAQHARQVQRLARRRDELGRVFTDLPVLAQNRRQFLRDNLLPAIRCRPGRS